MQMVEFLYKVTVIKSNTLGNCPSCEIQFCERNGRVNSSAAVLCHVEITFFYGIRRNTFLARISLKFFAK